MSLYKKYRPQTLDQLIANDSIIDYLKGAIIDIETFPQAILITGETGCGKTTISRIIAKELNVVEGDYVEMDAAQFTGVDMVREIRQKMLYKPMHSSYRIYLLDECHMLSTNAQEALLKALEDTPKHVIFILATTDPQKLKKTLKGRCQHLVVNKLNNQEMRKLLKRISAKEGQSLNKDILDQIFESSGGHPRNAINILERVIGVPEEDRLEMAKKEADNKTTSIELCQALIAAAPWKKVSNLLKALQDEDAEGIRRHILGYSQSVLLNSSSTQAARIIEELYEPLYNVGFPGLVMACFNITNN